MSQIFIIFYLLFLLGCFIAAAFVIYHITRYSINKKSSAIMLFLFLTVFIFLIAVNFSIFRTIDFNDTFNFLSIFNPNSGGF